MGLDTLKKTWPLMLCLDLSQTLTSGALTKHVPLLHSEAGASRKEHVCACVCVYLCVCSGVTFSCHSELGGSARGGYNCHLVVMGQGC